MKHGLFLTIALISSAASAQKAIEPPRQTGLWISSQQSLIDLQTCSTRELVRFGRITPIPLTDGVMLDIQLPGGLFAGPGKPVVTFEFHEADGARKVTVAYRHPFSIKAAYGLFRDLGKRCFPEEWEAAGLLVPSKPKSD